MEEVKTYARTIQGLRQELIKDGWLPPNPKRQVFEGKVTFERHDVRLLVGETSITEVLDACDDLCHETSWRIIIEPVEEKEVTDAND